MISAFIESEHKTRMYLPDATPQPTLPSSLGLINNPTIPTVTDPPMKKPRAIKGKIRLNGMLYDTNCDCQEKLITCKPVSKLRVHQEDHNLNRGYSKEDLKRIIGRPSSFKNVKIDRTYFSCVDGRSPSPILGTPGGTFGEWLNALSVIEAIQNKNLSQIWMADAFRTYLQHGNGIVMYHCQDSYSLHNLEQNLHVNGITGSVVGLRVENPDVQYRDELLKDLVKPSNQGDYFLKAVLSDPQQFYMRRGLVRNWIRAFYTVLWDKNATDSAGNYLHQRIKLEVLDGDPEEKAWLNLRSSPNCEDEHISAAIAPERHLFVNHAYAVRVLRQQLATFFLTQEKLPVNRQQFFKRIDRQGRRNSEIFAERVAGATLPFYSVSLE